MKTLHFPARDFLELGYLLFKAVHSNRFIGFIRVLLNYRFADTGMASYNERRSARRTIVYGVDN